MTNLASLKDLAQKAPVRDGWHTVNFSSRPEVRARHPSGGTTWIAECGASEYAAYIAACSPEVILQLCEVVEKAREVIGWFPGPAAWHTTAPTDAADALRSALAALEGK